MTVSINNKPQDLPDHLTISQALQTLGITSFRGVAVSVNNHIIKKQEWDSHSLQLHDAVVLIRASQGG